MSAAQEVGPAGEKMWLDRARWDAAVAELPEDKRHWLRYFTEWTSWDEYVGIWTANPMLCGRFKDSPLFDLFARALAAHSPAPDRPIKLRAHYHEEPAAEQPASGHTTPVGPGREAEAEAEADVTQVFKEVGMAHVARAAIRLEELRMTAVLQGYGPGPGIDSLIAAAAETAAGRRSGVAPNPTTEEITMPTTPSGEAVADVTRVYDQLRGLYGPTVVTEAAALLDSLRGAAALQGYTAATEGLGWLITGAAEAAADRYRDSKQPGRTPAALAELLDVLRTELTGAGVTVVPNRASNSGVGIDALPDKPHNAPSGLAVSLFTNGGWDLTMNRPATNVVSIYAPVTAAGAREVAQMVREILDGRRPKPF